MKIERNFNKRTATLVDIRKPLVDHGKGDALGVQVVMVPAEKEGGGSATEIGVLRMHMTPDEAIAFAHDLTSHAQAQLSETGAQSGAMPWGHIVDIGPISKAERRILAYAETCAVDHGGLLEGRRMNSEDIEALGTLQEAGILRFGRIPFKTLETLIRGEREPTHWVTLTAAGWSLAQAVRRGRADADNSTNRRKVDAALAERAGA